MSTNYVEILCVQYVKPHPDADKLDIAIVRNTTIVVPKGEFTRGQKVVFFPPDMLIPERTADELGVKKYLKHSTFPGDVVKSQCRIGACRLRGQPSYGFIVPIEKVFFDADALLPEGTNVSAYFNAFKYEPPQKVRAEDAAADHPAFHQYTDIEHYYRFPEAIPAGLPVRITEKIHGTNSRVGLISVGDGHFEFMAGSHRVNRKKPESGTSRYWEPLEDTNVLELLTYLCDEQHSVILFGEIFGEGIQDMDYGIETGKRGYRVFDISVNGRYLDWAEVETVAAKFNVSLVPLLYRGTFAPDLVDAFTHGETTLGTPRCKFKGREGIVISSLKEDYYAPTGGRRVVKSVSADYLDRKGATDNA